MRLQFSYRHYLILAGMAATLFAGCKDGDPKYDVPTTYNFDNVSYSGQSQRMDMLEEMTEYMETARVSGTTLDAQQLKDMFANQNNPFSFTSTKQLKDKCFLGDQTLYEQYMDSLAVASASTQPGAQGVAGVASSLDGTEHFLLSATGWDYTEMIEKGLMGAVFYYQATGVYLSDTKIGTSVDNETVVDGEGTAMQHHWDEAFGYLGVPKDFPVGTTGLRYWGKAVSERDALLQVGQDLMDAFLLGRAAINNDDHETKAEQVPVIRDNWEKVVAACAIHELNEARSHIGDDALRNHEVSEAVAFIHSLGYNPTKKISDAQIDSLIGSFGTDLYVVTLATIDAARTTLSGIYGLDAIKDQL